ncbi:MAG: hypothetical protein ABL927_08630, partial [Bdellovibrionales bacterium]
MKIVLLLVASILGASNAIAVPSFPRELSCHFDGQGFVLKSNNSLWSQALNSRYHVQLQINLPNGAGDVAKASWANDVASSTRGNDQGLRQYVFTGSNGEKYFVELEFNTPFG